MLAGSHGWRGRALLRRLPCDQAVQIVAIWTVGAEFVLVEKALNSTS